MKEEECIQTIINYMKNPYKQCIYCNELVDIKIFTKTEICKELKEKLIYRWTDEKEKREINKNIKQLNFKINKFKINNKFIESNTNYNLIICGCNNGLTDRQKHLAEDIDIQSNKLYEFKNCKYELFVDLEFNLIKFISPFTKQDRSGYDSYKLISFCDDCLKNYKLVLREYYIKKQNEGGRYTYGYFCPYNNPQMIWNCIADKYKDLFQIKKIGWDDIYLPKYKLFIATGTILKNIKDRIKHSLIDKIEIEKVVYNIDFKNNTYQTHLMNGNRANEKLLKTFELHFKNIIFKDGEYISHKDIARKHEEVKKNILDKGKVAGFNTQEEYNIGVGNLDCVWLDHKDDIKVGFEVALTSGYLGDIAKLQESGGDLNVLIIKNKLESTAVNNILSSNLLKNFPRKLMIYNIFNGKYIIPDCNGNVMRVN